MAENKQNNKNASTNRRRVSSPSSQKVSTASRSSSHSSAKNNVSHLRSHNSSKNRTRLSTNTAVPRIKSTSTKSKTANESAHKVLQLKRKKKIMWFFIIIIALWMALRYLPVGTDAYSPLPFVIALIPLTTFILLPLLLVSFITHDTWQIRVIILLLIVQLVWASAYFVPVPHSLAHILGVPQQTSYAQESSRNASHKKSSITVMTVNSQYGHADTGTIVHNIDLHNVDVLAVQEVNEDFIKRLHDSGLTNIMPYEQLGLKTSHDNAGFNAIWSRIPLDTHDEKLLDKMGSHTPWIQIHIDNLSIRLVSTHPYSPQRGTHQWHHDITALQAISQNSSIPTIVMGDMNSSIYHPTLRKTIESGLTDTSLELHAGFHNTFPSSWNFIPSLIEIDHVLHTHQLRGVKIQTEFIPRTDHKALIATLEF